MLRLCTFHTVNVRDGDVRTLTRTFGHAEPLQEASEVPHLWGFDQSRVRCFGCRGHQIKSNPVLGVFKLPWICGLEVGVDFFTTASRQASCMIVGLVFPWTSPYKGEKFWEIPCGHHETTSSSTSGQLRVFPLGSACLPPRQCRSCAQREVWRSHQL